MKLDSGSHSTLFFLFLSCFGYSKFLPFHIHFRSKSSISTQKLAEILIKIVISLQIFEENFHHINIESYNAWSWNVFLFFFSFSQNFFNMQCTMSALILSSYGRCMYLCSLSRVHLFQPFMDCNPPGCSIHGIFQARILELVAISFSRGFF